MHTRSLLLCLLVVLLAACTPAADDATRVATLQQQVDSLQALLRAPPAPAEVGVATPATGIPISAFEVNQLKQRGLAHPVADLQADLMQHTDLIEAPASLGGTMRFLENQTYILTGRWALAAFEDGHNGGWMLLQYSVADGEITWEVIRSYIA